MSSPPSPTFYVDENLDGSRFVEVLISAGVAQVRCRDLGYRNTPDAIWIPRVTADKLIILTSDERIRYVPAERSALRRVGARLLVLKSGSRSVADRAQNLVNSQRAIYRYAATKPGPWMVTLRFPHKGFERGLSGKLHEVRI